MATDMTDLFQALYDRYRFFDEAWDAYTLTGGRFYRAQAPDAAVQEGPIVVVSQTGGNINAMFSKDTLEEVMLQMAVYDQFRNDASRASRVMKSLIAIFEYATFVIPAAEAFVCMRREGMQLESIEDRTHVQIVQNWMLTQHVPAWR